MSQPKIKSPFSTTNIHVRLAIVKENIVELTVYIFSQEFQNLNYFHKDEIRMQKDAQVNLLHQIEKTIAKQAQLAFHFSLPDFL